MNKFFLALALALACSTAGAQQSVIVPATTSQVAVAGTVAVATRIITGAAGKRTYITGISLIPVATSQVTITMGTGSNCLTGTSTPAGVMVFGAGQVLRAGDGNGAVLFTPTIADDICITIGTAAAPGFITFAQF